MTRESCKAYKQVGAHRSMYLQNLRNYRNTSLLRWWGKIDTMSPIYHSKHKQMSKCTAIYEILQNQSIKNK